MNDNNTTTIKLRNVPDYLLDTVIEPNRANRRLSSLVIALLEAYRDDDYVRQLINGTFTGADPHIQEGILENIRQAQKTLEALEFINENNLAYIQAGQGYFEQQTDIPSTPPPASSTPFPTDTRLSALEASVQGILEKLDMLLAGTPASISQPASPSSTPASPQPVAPPSPSVAPSSPTPSSMELDFSEDFEEPADTSDFDSLLSSINY